MKEQPVEAYFRPDQWHKLIHQENLIPSKSYLLTAQDLQFLTSDDTNPNLEDFSLTQPLTNGIKQLGGAVFVKAAHRTAKDSSQLDRRVTSAKDLVMLIKMSEYLTEALCEEEHSVLQTRPYLKQLQSGHDQFRAYVVSGRVVGMCQKDPSFLAPPITSNQLHSVKQLIKGVISSLPNKEEAKMVVEVYCAQNGHHLKVISLQPFHIHPLSLFTEDQLIKQSQKGKGAVLRVVSQESQLKTTDLREYKPGAELAHLNNANQWITFMQRDNQIQSKQ